MRGDSVLQESQYVIKGREEIRVAEILHFLQKDTEIQTVSFLYLTIVFGRKL